MSQQHWEEHYKKLFDGKENSMKYVQTVLFWNRPVHLTILVILFNVLIW